MKIKILGTRGLVKPSKPYHSKHSGILINEKILVDVGEKEFMNYNPEVVIFTHFHPDHAWFVSDNEKFSIDVPTYGPEEHKLVEGLKVVDGQFTIADYIFTPIPVIHSIKVNSLGYVVEKMNKKIFISGDVAWIEKQHHNKIENSDLVITEASFIKRGGQIRRKGDKIFGHTGLPDLVRMFSPLANRIVFMHYGSWFLKDVPKGKEKIKSLENSVELIPGYDGLELII